MSIFNRSKPLPHASKAQETFEDRVSTFVSKLEAKWAFSLKALLTETARTEAPKDVSNASKTADTALKELAKILENLVAIYEHEAREEREIDVDRILESFEKRSDREAEAVGSTAAAYGLKQDLSKYQVEIDDYNASVESAKQWTKAELRMKLRKLQMDRDHAQAEQETAKSTKSTARWTFAVAIFTLAVALITAWSELSKKTEHNCESPTSKSVTFESPKEPPVTPVKPYCDIATTLPPCLWKKGDAVQATAPHRFLFNE